MQAERQQRELSLLAEQVEDPCRDAEVQLLRDDCRFLKVGAYCVGGGWLQGWLAGKWLAGGQTGRQALS